VPDDPCTTDTCETVTGGQRCSRANNSGPCDDRDACTSGDVCNATTGACAGTRIDTDGDTYGPGLCGGDCNDANRDVHPFAPEICNGIDDDCNGLTDDGPGMTCRPGSTRTCEATGSGGILCAGTQTCNGTTCTWNTTCALGAAEICNGADDDCDGTVDEGFTCARGSSRTCTATGAGGATCPGTQACLNDCSGYGACVATAVEVCNGLDDDCDTLTDETFSCVRGATSACTRTGAGGRTCSGTRTCGDTCAWGECTVTTAETCNGLDDDCDTLVDEDFPCTPGQVGSCTVGGCAGTRTCSASCAWGACTATAAEVCNGLDDDCDTLTDEGFTCALGATQTCTTSCSSTGSRTCVSGCVWGTCVPPAEACNGIDDDCDTVIDNGFPCVRNATGVACTNTCGAAGMTDCSATCTLGTCCVPTEICGNGCDDDCDTLTDEGCAAVGTPCSGDGDCGGGGGGLICNENWGICVVADCTGQPNFQPCETITTPDRSYDICSGGTCVSPGCGTAACNAPGPGFPLADTNQRTCHDNSTALASCPGGTPPGAACDTTAFCGQDAQYGWDTRNPASARFTRTVPVADQPVVLDNVTGLEWQGCTAGMTGDASSCTGTESTRIWTGALAYCDGLTWGGYSDWRLPDNFELLSIVDRGVISDPPIDGSAFPGTPAGGNALWSSSSDAAAPYKARYVAFFNGGLTASAEKTYGYSVRCVRRRPSTVPNPRFARREPLSGEFVVDDAATGLVWQGCAAGRAGEACSGTASRMNWQTALDHCQDSTWAGFSDWHLPSAIELQSILENSRFFPAIDATSFPGTPTDYFLSSSSNARNPIQMWAADFNGGLLGPFLVKSQTFYVRCVRAGP
jgi:hypothetical protein